MKHKFKIIAVLFLVSTFIFTSCSKDDLLIPKSSFDNTKTSNVELTYISNGASVKLLAGQTIEAGTIDLSIVNNNLIVTYNTTNGWELKEVHLFVNENFSLLPKTNSGNPQVGLFPYKAQNLNGATTYSFTIPLSEFGGEEAVCNKSIYVAAHASLQKLLSNGSYQTETGWGEGQRITAKGNWAMYYSFTFGCQAEEPELANCETAFAFGNTTFIDMGLTNNRWGWVIEAIPGFYTTPIYAAAGNNIISNGFQAGILTYSYRGSYLTLDFKIMGPYKLSETHVYVSNTPPSTIAPGQYGNTHILNAATADNFRIENLNGGKVYIIAHAVVCSSQN